MYVSERQHRYTSTLGCLQDTSLSNGFQSSIEIKFAVPSASWVIIASKTRKMSLLHSKVPSSGKEFSDEVEEGKLCLQEKHEMTVLYCESVRPSVPASSVT